MIGVFLLIVFLIIWLIVFEVNKEDYSAWFPRVYLKDVRLSNEGKYKLDDSDIGRKQLRTMSNDVNNPIELEAPIFGFFDNGNAFKSPREVDSLYAPIKDTFKYKPSPLDMETAIITPKPSDKPIYNSHVRFLQKRGGNA